MGFSTTLSGNHFCFRSRAAPWLCHLTKKTNDLSWKELAELDKAHRKLQIEAYSKEPETTINAWNTKLRQKYGKRYCSC